MQGVLGAKLKKARTELGLSQGAVGRTLSLSSEFISLLEADKRAPSLATLNKIAAYLKKDLQFFQEKEGAFNVLLRGDALKGPEGLDAASQAVLQRFKRYCDDYLRLERLAGPGRGLGLAPLYSNISPPVSFPSSGEILRSAGRLVIQCSYNS
jgi:transcriptional regulator with XRE-family HTH domain